MKSVDTSLYTNSDSIYRNEKKNSEVVKEKDKIIEELKQEFEMKKKYSEVVKERDKITEELKQELKIF